MTQNDTMTKHNNLEFHLKNSLNVGLSFQPEKGFCHLGGETLHLRHPYIKDGMVAILKKGQMMN